MSPALLATYIDADRAAVRRALPIRGDAELAAAYEARGYRRMWDNASGDRIIAALRASADDGLDAEAYDAETLAQRWTSRATLSPDESAALDLAMTAAFARYLADMKAPAGLAFVDQQLAPPARRAILSDLATAPDAEKAVAAAMRVNPLYIRLRRALREAAPADRDLLRTNLDRLRGLPADLGERYVLVDVTAQRLSMVEGGRTVDEMNAVVGRPAMATPTMAAMIRYALYNPYWNIPPDLARASYARRALADPRSPGRQGIEVLSDWSEGAVPLDPVTVDWQAVVEGRLTPRLRQLPGEGNMMGRVKFMLPNNLGIYLHDTPERTAFTRSERLASAGCVRLEDAQRLGRWLFGREVGASGDAPEQRLDLPAPVPVYIVYLTVDVRADGKLERRRDIYGRDAALGVRSLAARQRSNSAAS